MAIAEHLSLHTDTRSGSLNRVLSLREIGRATMLKDDAPVQYTSSPAFAEGVNSGVIVVASSKYALGTRGQTLATQFVRECSGFIIKNPAGSTFGLYHASPLPFIDLTEFDFVQLQAFANGQITEIKGSESTNKDHILRRLKNRLGIDHTGAIEVQTRDQIAMNRPFHIALVPETNEVLVARNSHRDVLRYQAFR